MVIDDLAALVWPQFSAAAEEVACLSTLLSPNCYKYEPQRRIKALNKWAKRRASAHGMMQESACRSVMYYRWYYHSCSLLLSTAVFSFYIVRPGSVV